MKDKKSIYFVLYYVVLLLMMATRTNAETEPPMAFRLVYLLAVILPCLVNKAVSFPAIITTFLTVGHYGFSYSYMPYMTYIYGYLTLMMTFLCFNQKQGTRGSPRFLVLFTIYVFIRDLISILDNSQAHFPEDVDWCFLMLICFFYIAYSNENNTKKQLSISFAVITVVLSLIFLIFRNQFVQVYDERSGLERSGWADPNYYSLVIGMGVVIGVFKRLSHEWNNLSYIEKNLYRAAVILSLPTIALLASRGATLSVLVAVVVLMMYTKARKGYKIALVVIAIFAILWLYQNQFFELLEYRLTNDDGTGSQRTVIWARKLDLFFAGNLFQWIFGFGFAGGFYIGGVGEGFHNDYLAFLVDYGIIGLAFLMYMLYYPYKLLSRSTKERPLVVALIAYLVVGFLTLEPLTHALMMFFTLYFYTVLVAKDKSEIHS